MKQTNKKTNRRAACCLWNSPAGTYTRRDVIRAAWNVYASEIREMLCDTYAEVRVLRHDRRYIFNIEAESAARAIIDKKGRSGIIADREKHRQRTRAKVEEWRRPANVLQSSIVRDYVQNRHNLRRVCPDRLVFDSRNHWAETAQDRKVLAILAAHFNK